MLKLFTTISLLVICTAAFAQSENEPLFVEKAKKRHPLLPDYAKVQFAGSMGMFSAGVGYHLFKEKFELDLMAGFLPQAYSRDELQVITLRVSSRIWQLRSMGDWTITPLTAGLFVTYTHGGKFSSALPRHYPDGYYWWSEAVRPNIFIGGRVTKRFTNNESLPKLTFYYEIGTNELKLVSYALNTETLSPFQILHAGVGVKLHFE